MGQLRQLEAAAAHDLGETPSRSAICWVQGRRRRAALADAFARVSGGKRGISARGGVSPLSPGLFAEGHEEGCVKKELAGFTQPDCHWNEK